MRNGNPLPSVPKQPSEFKNYCIKLVMEIRQNNPKWNKMAEHMCCTINVVARIMHA